jgi:hypothetical protein
MGKMKPVDVWRTGVSTEGLDELEKRVDTRENFRPCGTPYLM